MQSSRTAPSCMQHLVGFLSTSRCLNWAQRRIVPSHRQFSFATNDIKCTLVHALRLCTGRTAHRRNRGIALPFLDHGTRRGRSVSVTPRPLFTPGKRPGTHCTGGWVVSRADLDRCGKSRPHRDSIPGPL